MKLGIMQPYFFPYIGYWQLMNAVDKYVVYDDVNFIKGGWINRNRILINGMPTYFNLPLLGASPNKHINEVQVNFLSNMFNKNLRTLEMVYSKAPFFEQTYSLVEKIFNCKKDTLAEFLLNSFHEIADYLDIATEFVLSSSLQKNNELHGQDKILDICKCLKATEYYNAIGGQSLYNPVDFANAGIKLFFLQTEEICYKQFSDLFVPNLSVLDVMMFNSADEIKRMLQQFHLISGGGQLSVNNHALHTAFVWRYAA